MTQVTTPAEAEPVTTEIVDNTKEAPAPKKEVKAKKVKLSGGTTQVNYI